MNNIIKMIQKNKKILIVVLVVLLVAAVSLGYVLKNKNADHNQNTSNITDNKNDKNSDEKKKDNKQKETTSTKDEKKPSVKEDNKSDEKKTDVKPEATVAPSNDATVEEINNTTSNNVSNNTASNSTSNNNTPAPCVPTYTTVNHPAVGHYEQREIMPAYNKPVYAEKLIGGKTGRVYTTLDEFYNQDEDTNYAVQRVQVDTEYVPAEYDNVWVEDQPAYTTTEESGC